MTALLLFFSLKFTFGGEAPMLFGNNVFVIDTDAFDQIEKGSAVIVSEAAYDTILAGTIVVYQNSEKKAGIAEVQKAELVDNVYTYIATSDRGVSLVLSQNQIIGKAVQYSTVLGGLISFATSPAGVLVIAILPCGALIAYELIKFIMERIAQKQSVRPVKKQDEIPTYIPRQKAEAIKAYKKVEQQTADNVDYDMEEDVRRRQPAYSASDLMGIEDTVENADYPIFRAPKRAPSNPAAYDTSVLPPVNRAPSRARAPKVDPIPKNKPMPVSQKRLMEVMAQTKNPNSTSAPSSRPVNEVQLTPPQRATPPSQPQPPPDRAATAEIPRVQAGGIQEKVKQFIPKAKPQTPKVSAATSSLPRLDQLLNDESESENTRYDIEDILSSLEKR